MPSFLLEIFSEEIPARMQAEAARHLQAAFADAVKQAGIDCKDIKTFVTPRRVALIADGIPEVQPDATIEKKGPKTNAPQAALDGFLRKENLSVDKLEKRMLGKDEVYFAVVHQKGQPTAAILKTIIEKILSSFPWPKSMRWGSGQTPWVRPLHAIIAILGSKVISVEFAGIKAGNVTYGHRFLAPKAITINNASEYESALLASKVIADPAKRKAEIVKQAEAVAAKAGLTVKRDDGLQNEVTGLVEWPNVLVGTIDNAFMDLPPEVLTSEMRAHQKYFALLNKNGSMSDKFLITSNMVTNDGGKAIIAGNERVLRARLADGRFFFDHDRKKKLEDWADGLKNVTFHTKIGTIAQKVTQIRRIAGIYLAKEIPNIDKELAERAAILCKADLMTGMVGEFPELQGIMGRYYALHQGEKPEVADAIRDHYLPLGPDSPVPTMPISICIALADKFDTLISMFAVGEKPTGSKDPFALRRSALGIIRIVLENEVRINLFLVCLMLSFFDYVKTQKKNIDEQTKQAEVLLASIKKLDESYTELNTDIIISKIYKNNLTINPTDESRLLEQPKEIFDFFIERLKVMLRDQGIRHDIINAVKEGDIVRMVARAKAVQSFLTTDDGKNLLAAYKRAVNILTIEEKKDKTTYAPKVKAELMQQEEEKFLFKAFEKATPAVVQAFEKEKFSDAMSALATLRAPVDTFFDKVMVNAEDKAVRANRLSLLATIRAILDKIANFSLIEG